MLLLVNNVKEMFETRINTRNTNVRPYVMPLKSVEKFIFILHVPELKYFYGN